MSLWRVVRERGLSQTQFLCCFREHEVTPGMYVSLCGRNKLSALHRFVPVVWKKQERCPECWASYQAASLLMPSFVEEEVDYPRWPKDNILQADFFFPTGSDGRRRRHLSACTSIVEEELPFVLALLEHGRLALLPSEEDAELMKRLAASYRKRIEEEEMRK